MNPRSQAGERELKQIFQEADRAAKIVRTCWCSPDRTHRAAEDESGSDLNARHCEPQGASYTGRDQIVRNRGETPADHVVSRPPAACLPELLINAEHALADGGGPRRIENYDVDTESAENVTLTILDYVRDFRGGEPRFSTLFSPTKDVGQGTASRLASLTELCTSTAGRLPPARRRLGRDFPDRASAGGLR